MKKLSISPPHFLGELAFAEIGRQRVTSVGRFAPFGRSALRHTCLCHAVCLRTRRANPNGTASVGHPRTLCGIVLVRQDPRHK